MKSYNDPLHISYEQLTVTFNNAPVLMLNKALLDQQNCWENLEAIKEVHWLKLVLHSIIMETQDSSLLQDLARDITECEFELQRLWKFTRDSKFHRFWDTPKCQCPKIDNNDWYPTGHYIINQSCPLHGAKV